MFFNLVVIFNISFSSRIMRFLLTGSFLFVALVVLTTAEEWSWSKDKDQKKPAADADSAVNRESKSIDSYSGINDNSNQNDDSSEASLSGNSTDTQPRHVIRDRLCGLGLMEVIINGSFTNKIRAQMLMIFTFYCLRRCFSNQKCV